MQRHRGGGFYLGTSLSTRVFTKDQIYFDSKDAVIKEIANYIQKYTDEFCGCDSIMLNGDDGAKIIPELALAGIKFDGVEGKVNLDTEWQEIQKERNRF